MCCIPCAMRLAIPCVRLRQPHMRLETKLSERLFDPSRGCLGGLAGDVDTLRAVVMLVRGCFCYVEAC